MEQVEQYVPLVASPHDGEASILNEETYNTLKGMLNSNNEADHKMAQLILNSCDIRKSIYWIWRLSREYYTHRMVNLRTKASRSFRDLSNLFSICQRDSLTFAEWLDRKGWMTSEIYQRLEEDILHRVHRTHTHSFYDVTIKIKDEYAHLPSNKDDIPLKSKRNGN